MATTLNRSQIRTLILNEIYGIDEILSFKRKAKRKAKAAAGKVASTKIDDEELNEFFNVVNSIKATGTNINTKLGQAYGEEKKPLWHWLFTKVFKVKTKLAKKIMDKFSGIVKFATIVEVMFKFAYITKDLKLKPKELVKKFHDEVVPNIIEANAIDFIVACVYATNPGIGLLGSFIIDFLKQHPHLKALEEDLDAKMKEWNTNKIQEIKDAEVKEGHAQAVKKGKQVAMNLGPSSKQFKMYASKMKKSSQTGGVVAESKKIIKFNRRQLRSMLTSRSMLQGMD